MKIQSPEYQRVRKQIAQKYCGHNSKIGMILADRILAIEGLAIIADDQTKPINHWGNYYGIAQHDMEVVGFKKVVE
jgi:hypothetical protein